VLDHPPGMTRAAERREERGRVERDIRDPFFLALKPCCPCQCITARQHLLLSHYRRQEHDSLSHILDSTHQHTHADTHTHTQTHTQTRTHTDTHADTDAHIRTHTQMQTHTHTRVCHTYRHRGIVPIN
jgi:hypothetical protein